MNAKNDRTTRTPLNIKILFRRNYARDNTTGILKNISLTGAFLAHAHHLQVGEKLHILFSIAGREREVESIVIWCNNSGAGIKFLPQNSKDVQIVDDLIYFVESKRSGTRDIFDLILKKVS